MDIQVLGPDSRSMCYFYVPELPDVLVIAGGCQERTLNDEHHHITLYCIKHDKNYHIPKCFQATGILFLWTEMNPNWGWIGKGNYNSNNRIMHPAGYRCWYRSGPLSDIPKNLSILMEIYKKNITSGVN